MTALGLDTSNYTTSAAVFDGREGCNAGKLLEVRPGERGLRQSDALFQHVNALPDRLRELGEKGMLHGLAAVAASTRPRAVEGSYMPCFRAGESLGRSIAALLDLPFFAVSHQQGHLAAAAWSAGRIELLDAPFLAWHLSGGTTELLYVRPEGTNVAPHRIGGTTDISAGQLIDRTGVLLGLSFPAGKALDELSGQAEGPRSFPVKVRDMEFSLSGVENQVKALLEKGTAPEEIGAFVLNTVSDTVRRASLEARNRFPGLPLLCSGGVASNRRLREVLVDSCGGIFAQSQYASDNAMGVAILAHRQMGQKGEEKNE